MAKTLEERYNEAGSDTYVGRVRTLQSADATSDRGVNFLDGAPRNQGNDAPDEYQTEFTRNEPGAFRYGGGGLEPGATNDGSYPLSRWLDKGVQKAFEGSESYFLNNRYTSIGDVRNAPGTRVHNYAPVSGKRFDESVVLSELSKGKIFGSPKGPSPAGLQG
jgi:hypothetical protein